MDSADRRDLRSRSARAALRVLALTGLIAGAYLFGRAHTSPDQTPDAGVESSTNGSADARVGRELAASPHGTRSAADAVPTSPVPIAVAPTGADTSLRGEVVSLAGAGWSRMRIHLVPLAGDQRPTDADLLSSTAVTTASPAFSFSNIARGRYEIGLEIGPGFIQSRRSIEVSDVASPISIYGGAVPDFDALTVDFRGPDGVALADATASVIVTDGRSTVRQHAYQDIPSSVVGPGRWRFAMPRGPFRSWTRSRIEANWPGHWAQAVEFRQGIDRVVTVTFQSATVDVVVEVAEPVLPAGLTAVFLDDVGVEPVVFYPGELDRGVLRDGKVTIDPVGVGDYDLHLVVRPEPRGTDPRSVAAKRVHLVPGRNLVRITAPSFASVEIARPGDAGGWAQIERAQVSPLLTRWETKAFDRKGVAEFDFYPPGRYVVTAFSGAEKSDGEMLVSLPAKDRIVFEPGPIDSILVRIVDASGTLGQLGLRDGDRIVAIDGVAFRTSKQVRTAISQATLRDSFVADVVRDGAHQTITLDGRVVLAELEIGGHLECGSSK